MKARIYKPARTAMQQGRARSDNWQLEFEPQLAKRHDPLMGWVGSGDTSQQIRLLFESEEAAVAYCEKHGLDYVLRDAHERKFRPKSYADNFRWSKPA